MTTHAHLPHWENANNEEKLAKLHTMLLDLYRYVQGDNLQTISQILKDHLAQPDCTDEKEIKDIQLILELCRKHPNILSSNCEVGHITGSALVLDAASQRLLLNYHPKFDRWLQFGGHPEYEATPWQIALRETQEESGLSDLYFYPPLDPPKLIDVDVHVIAERKGQPEHYHLDFRYLLLTDSPELAAQSSESKEIRWFSFEEALALPDLEFSLVRLIKKAQKLLNPG